MADAEFPWYFDRTANAYRFADGYSLKRLELDGDELFGLVAMRSLGASLGGTIGAYIGGITDKLVGSSRGAKERVSKRSPLAFRLSGIELGEQGERVFELLSAAERSSRSAAFTYSDKESRATQRTVDPYGFVVSGGRVYCVAFDHARKDMRTFAVDSVEDAQVLARTFIKPSDFDVEAYAASTISGVLSSGVASEVKVRFEPRVAKAALAAKIVADRTVEQRDDGVEITYRVANADELVRWVLGWGVQAEIVAPESARERARELATGIAAKYA
ncbi:MAG TPA: WYL domain-containing protein [Verrucomicrobiae bacterium]|nr:WYL domain-containing protein [Verrucomicrobiae bacterium]